jgi:hypothetical protein
MATSWYGPNSTDALCFCIEEFLEDCGDDPAYAQCAQKLREVQRELDVLCESPGHRAANRAMADTSTGHAQTSEPAGT